MSSVLRFRNTRNFCEFYNTSIAIPETSGSYIRSPYPHPEFSNPTEHNLRIKCVCVCKGSAAARYARARNNTTKHVKGAERREKRPMIWYNERFDTAKSYLCIADYPVLCCAVCLLPMPRSDRYYGCNVRGGANMKTERTVNHESKNTHTAVHTYTHTSA